MIRKTLAIIILLATVQPALSQSFVARGRPEREEPFIDTGPSVFGDSFSDFNNSLEKMGSVMRKEYDDSQLAAEKKRQVEAQATQTDTENVLNQSFQNSQYQAAASGGLYNNPGGTGYGGGGFAWPRVQGKYYGSGAPKMSFTVPANSGIYKSNYYKKH